MGYSKVVVDSPTRVRFVHQLDQNGEAYAEDVTIEVQDGVDPGRLSYFVAQAGKVGVISYSFSGVVDDGTRQFPGES